MKKRDGYIIWPEYFDKNLSKRFGRKVPKNLAVENPKIEDLIKAVQRLKLDYKVEESSFPSVWWEKSGRLIVKYQGRKNELLKKIAKELKILTPKKKR
ncbi:MAG: signal recognition particle subunit SRP19/SEC65 family protein [Candidatus Asgardarchaeum sp.]|nr:signal recognition particle protein Srp19 [Candidatus Odinarchaeota archaeon]